MSDEASELAIREASDEDRDALASFRCSTGPWYEQEVENYINRFALEAAIAGPINYRLLLAHEEGRLVACAAHRPEGLLTLERRLRMAHKVEFLALSLTDQGKTLKDGKKLSDLLMESVIHDALTQAWEPRVVTGLVALDNVRSLALCARVGLRSQVRHSRDYARVWGHFSP